MNAEPSEEMLLLFRDYLRANRTATIAGNMQQQQQQLPKNAGRPFVNMYQMMADYKLRPAMANIFSRTLEMAKTRVSERTAFFLFCQINFSIFFQNFKSKKNYLDF